MAQNSFTRMKTLALLLPMAVCMAGCGRQGGAGGASLSSPLGEDKRVTVTPDSVYYSVDDSEAVCYVRADVPEAQLEQPVAEWLDEALGGRYDGSSHSVAAVVDFYGRSMTDTLRARQRELSMGVPYEFEALMERAAETDQWVTYTLQQLYALGGAHPTSGDEGATFRKSDGRRIGWDIVRRTESEPLRELMVERLKRYLQVASDEEMEQMTGRSVYDLQLPSTPPFLTDKGVVFVYQQYELGSYAIGMPRDTISYEQIGPLLTGWAKRLVWSGR